MNTEENNAQLPQSSVSASCGSLKMSCEIDEEYFEKGVERIKNITNQQKLF